jgi:HD-GYP domain-containing protein (c-di-GMP phosphodiesterase class II)
MKLSDSKFVKVLKANDAFLPSDAERFSSKSLQYLFITRSDADAYIKNFQKNIQLLVGSKPKTNTELSIITVEALETVTSLSRALGWKPEVMEAAKYAVELAIKAVSAEPDVLKLLKHKMSDPSSNYASHVSIISLMACGFCHSLGWHSEMAQMKLGLAAMVHDITVDESYYSDIHKWNAIASEVTDKSSAAMKYRNHPLDAATLILQMKNVVPDVDQIVLQHHEAKDGSGFPRRLTSSRISPMACIFIITEDFVNFIDNGPDINEKIDTFIFSRETKYNSGNFKKIFDAIKESIQRSRAHHS